MNQKQWPVTIDEAVGVVIATLADEFALYQSEAV